MTTDHTETPEPSTFEVLYEMANTHPTKRGEMLGLLDHLRKGYDEARAALATAMEERDEAIELLRNVSNVDTGAEPERVVERKCRKLMDYIRPFMTSAGPMDQRAFSAFHELSALLAKLQSK